jgi:hypothetical protein
MDAFLQMACTYYTSGGSGIEPVGRKRADIHTGRLFIHDLTYQFTGTCTEAQAQHGMTCCHDNILPTLYRPI